MARVPANRLPLTVAMSQGQNLLPAILPKLQMQLPDIRKSNRLNRRPAHDWLTVSRPWDVQPVAIHPILPGDTLQNMLMQARAVTDPIKHKLSGWWNEYYLFFVDHLSLGTDDEGTQTTADAIRAMHLSNTALGLQDATERLHHYKVGTASAMDWLLPCMKQIVRWYFRDGEEPIDGYGSYGVRNTTLYKARVRDPMWLESVKIEDVNPSSQGDLPGVEDFNDVFVPTAWSTHYAQWEHMRQVKLIPDSVSFEDYLESFGVSAPPEEKEVINRPELLRYHREWQYPSNTIDPSDGSAASAVSWGIQARADKPRYFNKPGFLVLVNVVRPKVFFGNQKRTAVSMLDDAYGWLPAILANDPYTSLIEYDHDEGPLAGVFNSADDYWVDRRDLFVRGDQFVNFDPADAVATGPIVDLPKVAGADNDINLWYASDTDAQNLFVDDDNSDGLTFIRQDGVVKFNIKSAYHAARDHT